MTIDRSQHHRFDAVALQQVGWLGHNDEKFYYLREGELCRKNNSGGFSPLYEQVGSYDSEGVFND